MKYALNNWKPVLGRTYTVKSCIHCGDKFTGPNWVIIKREYCSRACVDDYKRTEGDKLRITKQCIICDDEFEVQNFDSHRKYCSNRCHLKVHNGNLVKNSKTTRPEFLMEEFLKESGVNYETQFEVEYKYYDFYLPEFSVLLEVDGTYWHGKGLSEDELNPRQLKNRLNDIRKNEIASRNGYTIIRIWEDEIYEDIERVFYERIPNICG